jgi:hypothetical protein
LIGSAFAIDWIFGVGFIFGFGLAIWNKVLERNFLIPVFIFIGALIIRYALGFIPNIINAQDFVSLGISLILFITILIAGWRIKKGKWKVWKIRFLKRGFRKGKKKFRKVKKKIRKIKS